MQLKFLAGWVWVAGCAAMVAGAQDTRTVVEPTVPPVCKVLFARLYAAPDVNGGKLDEADEDKLDTGRIQKALDDCGPGRAVRLKVSTSIQAGKPGSRDSAEPEGSVTLVQVPEAGRSTVGAARPLNAFLSGPLELREGVTLLIDKGVTVYGSRNPRVYEIADPDAKPGDAEAPIKCGTSMPRPASFPAPLAADAKARRGGCRPLVTIANVKNAAIMGEGTLDGRGYAKILGKSYSWWEQARAAEPKDDLYFNPRMITATHADGLVLYGITLHNSPNFHVGVNATDGFTAWGVHLQTPVNKKLLGTPNDARNTDGIDPGMSTNVTVAHSWIDNGDDNIAVKSGVSHMSVLDNHFYTGHGMSIGSETVPGQSYLFVDELTEDHTTSGIRIKSNVKRGGPVHDLTYRNICMRDVPIPIAISPYYTNQTVEPFEDPKYVGDKIPDYKKITLENIVSETPGDVLIAGLNDAHRTGVTLRNVEVTNIQPSQLHLAYDDLTVLGPGTNLPFSKVLSNNKTVTLEDQPGQSPVSMSGDRHPDVCRGMFLPYR